MWPCSHHRSVSVLPTDAEAVCALCSDVVVSISEAQTQFWKPVWDEPHSIGTYLHFLGAMYLARWNVALSLYREDKILIIIHFRWMIQKSNEYLIGFLSMKPRWRHIIVGQPGSYSLQKHSINDNAKWKSLWKESKYTHLCSGVSDGILKLGIVRYIRQ